MLLADVGFGHLAGELIKVVTHQIKSTGHSRPTGTFRIAFDPQDSPAERSSQIKRPRRPAPVPRLYSMAEVENLLTVGTEGNLRACAFPGCVYGGGLRLSEATHIQIKDLDGVRHRLLVSHSKGHHQRYTLLSDNLLIVLRDYYCQASVFTIYTVTNAQTHGERFKMSILVSK
jgi:site-specific recombinase XerD